MGDDRPEVSVVVPVYNAVEELPQQLAALARQHFDGRFEVILADNGSTDGSRDVGERFRSRFSDLSTVDASQRRGPSYARNLGARAARAGVIVFCDADDVVDDGWLTEMMAAARDGGDLLLCSQEILGGAPGWDDPYRRIDASAFAFLPWGGGGCMGVTAEAFAAVGGFDEALEFGEDVDFCWRVQLAGFTCKLVPDALVRVRMRTDTKALLKQQFRIGLSSVRLHREYRAYGKPSPSLGRVLRGYWWSLTRAPFALHRDRRFHWVATSMQRLGRLWGSIRYRVWHP